MYRVNQFAVYLLISVFVDCMAHNKYLISIQLLVNMRTSENGVVIIVSKSPQSVGLTAQCPGWTFRVKRCRILSENRISGHLQCATYYQCAQEKRNETKRTYTTSQRVWRSLVMRERKAKKDPGDHPSRHFRRGRCWDRLSSSAPRSTSRG